MAERMSPAYRAGLIHGAYAAARPARYLRGFIGFNGEVGWQYRRGFARAFRAARGLPPLERKHQALGRCWCRGYHGMTEAIDMNGRGRRAATQPAAGAGTAGRPERSPLEQARDAARRG